MGSEMCIRDSCSAPWSVQAGVELQDGLAVQEEEGGGGDLGSTGAVHGLGQCRPLLPGHGVRGQEGQGAAGVAAQEEGARRRAGCGGEWRTRQEERELSSQLPQVATTGLEPTVVKVTWWDRGPERGGGEQPPGYSSVEEDSVRRTRVPGEESFGKYVLR